MTRDGMWDGMQRGTEQNGKRLNPDAGSVFFNYFNYYKENQYISSIYNLKFTIAIIYLPSNFLN